MLQGWVVVVSALVYIGLLFAVASYGDRIARTKRRSAGRPVIYSLSLAVYCTSWTFFGSVGLAAQDGLQFLTIYIGPAIVIALGFPLLRRIVRLAKSERITSIADFIAARYGKNQWVAAVVTIIAVCGTVPYIALQLKAVSLSTTTLFVGAGVSDGTPVDWMVSDIALLVALGMAVFAVAFGTRHIDATEHQEGLMLAIATESIVKLIAFLAVGLYVTFGMFDGPGDLLKAAQAIPTTANVFTAPMNGSMWMVMTTLSLFAAIMLPRQFHVTVTENNNVGELRLARWMFPFYLVLINLFVVPIAAAGLLTFGGAVDADIFVLALPMVADQPVFTMLAFIGGLSAATAMVIVACVALAIMISNDLVIPLVLRRRVDNPETMRDMGRFLLHVRRTAIFATLLLAYAYYRAAGDSAALASIGLLSFAAIAQFGPAFFGGLFWRRATARGAILGMSVGFAMWCYTLLLPTFAASGLLPSSWLTDGPFGILFLRPQALFGIDADPLVHGFLWALSLNILAYVIGSLSRAPEPIERLQANLFLPDEFSPSPSLRLWRTAVTVEDLRSTVARYLGAERTDRSFERFAREQSIPLDPNAQAEARMLRFAEQLLASAIGAASSRLVLSLLVKRRDPATKGAMKLLDDASAAIQYNRDLLQTALDQVQQGISVFDQDLRLICWNRQFRELLGLPPEYGQVGTPLDAILRYNAERGEFGLAPVETLVNERLEALAVRMETVQDRIASTQTVLEVRTSPMPGGGIVTTYTDITEQVHAEQALARSNETLERRVRERTEELTHVNEELVRAKREADEANLSKTRFLAAAGHDILQPLNAARLYAASLMERFEAGRDFDMVRNVELSLDSVEEILGAVLDISRLDTGQMQTEISSFRLDTILNQLRREFEPVAREKNLDLRILATDLTVRSDRRLLRRLLQNLVSNAIKYTNSGRILVGCRRHRNRVNIEVFDTGIGIPASKREEIFEEFRRLDDGARVARGLGLGLSIVERISRVLDHPVSFTSRVSGASSRGRSGSRFAVTVPLAATIPAEEPPASQPLPKTSSLKGMLVAALDNEASILAGMEALLAGWQCRTLTALDPAEAAMKIADFGETPEVLLVDYHLDHGSGIDAIVQLRWKFGANIPAILITADRTPAVRKDADSRDIHLLNKPLKPAALRAYLTRLRSEAQKPVAVPEPAAQ
ncbi:NahK/ErcS family hybrid sensor histidine kinase/response regulator [Breoghania sp.]|uniref:NahK/ErcS family hybrid sensor histidine kinase/response regulator n=1 Tax=Breoghania sp. TaxID=2065378 RepID=UPI0029CA9B78|nr:NahK/ErcS family hybrid sensor histidine kinase/response regulator [Breoghania sp.]